MRLILKLTLSTSVIMMVLFGMQKLLAKYGAIYEVDLPNIHLKISESLGEKIYGGERNRGLILIERGDFSVDNLNKISRWYSRRFLDISEIDLLVITDPSLMKSQLPTIRIYPNLHSDSWIHSYEAHFYRNGKGENEFYRYTERDSDPNNLKTVIVKGKDPFAVVQNLEIKRLESTGIELQVKSFSLRNVTPSGVYNTFEAKPPTQKDWTPIITIRSNASLDLSKKYIFHVNENVAYLAAQWVYAVTFDGGANWVKWDGMDKMNSLDCCPEDFIESVQILPNGEGEMKLNNRGEGATKLYTKDYGKTWSPQ